MMKSRLFKFSRESDIAKRNKSFDLVKYYKTAADSSTSLKKDSKISNNKEPSEATSTPKRRRSIRKDTKKTFTSETMNVTKTDIDGQHSFLNDSKITSTPNVSKYKNTSIKSIMKGATESERSLDMSNVAQINRKKRNKSVSFMLEENEEVIVKKTKSDVSLESKILDENSNKRKKNKIKKQQKEDKENNDLKIKNNNFRNASQNNECMAVRKSSLKKNKQQKPNPQINDNELREDNKNLESDDNSIFVKQSSPILKKPNIHKKRRKHDKKNININKADKDEKNEVSQVLKNKHKAETSEIGEPAKKAIKRNKRDVISEGIQNLNIGDNAHTLTNLLNGMTVNSNKKLKVEKSSNSELKSEHKTKSKKNNKKRKNRNPNAVVLVQNLPFKVLLSYKQLLKDWFSKYGTVHSIGIADLKCNKDESKPIFTTRIFFKKEEEAALAQAEDKVLFEGNIIRVKKYTPPEARVLKLDSRSETAERQKSEEATSDNSENVTEESNSDK